MELFSIRIQRTFQLVSTHIIIYFSQIYIFLPTSHYFLPTLFAFLPTFFNKTNRICITHLFDK